MFVYICICIWINLYVYICVYVQQRLLRIDQCAADVVVHTLRQSCCAFIKCVDIHTYLFCKIQSCL